MIRSNILKTGLLVTAVLTLSGCAGSSSSPPTQVVPTNNPEWAEITLTATGRGAYPDNASGAQARLMATRAARADAYRKLTEQVYGLELRANTLVRDAVLESDQIETQVEGFIRGARVVNERDRPNLGIVEVEMELFLGEDFQRIVMR